VDATIEQMQEQIRQLMNQGMGGGPSAMPGMSSMPGMCPTQPQPPQPPQPPPGILRTKIFTFDLAAINGAEITMALNDWIDSVSTRAGAMQPTVLGVGMRLVVAFLYREVPPPGEGG